MFEVYLIRGRPNKHSPRTTHREVDDFVILLSMPNANSDRLVPVGIAGLGRSGWDIHAHTFASLQEKYQVVAVADPDSTRSEEAVTRFGCRRHDDYDALVNDPAVELLVVATPNRFHPDHAIQAMQAGHDVVCEKPMATRGEDADRVIKVAQDTGRVLAPFQNRRYERGFLKVREVTESGKLGQIVLIRIAQHGFGRRWDWQTLQKFDGGSLNNTGPHVLDEALELFGQSEPKVFCDLQRTLTSGDAEDHVKVILHGPNAPMVEIEITSACAFPQDPWLIMGTRGGLRGSSTSLEWKYVDFEALQPRPVDPRPTPDRSYNHEDLPWQVETWKAPAEQASPPQHFYRDLYQTLRHGAPLVITPESVRRQIMVLEQCHKLCPLD